MTSDKFLKSIEYGKIYHHVWEMVERGGVFEIKVRFQSEKINLLKFEFIKLNKLDLI